ncbi:capsid assembly scaffolding protein Gp46 family protein [Microaceticoccus formicicus]|uniref:capsid assembly scaffolding protein Gp46 family protein n=1 Tax=Microaceticoccus formicicus TaxID=3118105 RepID=UPI003CD008F3|nr:DUF4355 domain-containing protein [Peptoniphilaceae bacterium AMB_02]
MDFKAIETQEELDRIIGERLARERAKSSADYDALKNEKLQLEGELTTLKATLETTNTESQGLKKQIEELNGKLSGYETEQIKTKIALQHGLPFDLASRLVGTSEDEIKSDALKMSEYLTSSKPVPPLRTTEPENEGNDPYKNLLSNLKGE